MISLLYQIVAAIFTCVGGDAGDLCRSDKAFDYVNEGIKTADLVTDALLVNEMVNLKTTLDEYGAATDPTMNLYGQLPHMAVAILTFGLINDTLEAYSNNRRWQKTSWKRRAVKFLILLECAWALWFALEVAKEYKFEITNGAIICTDESVIDIPHPKDRDAYGAPVCVTTACTTCASKVNTLLKNAEEAAQTSGYVTGVALFIFFGGLVYDVWSARKYSNYKGCCQQTDADALLEAEPAELGCCSGGFGFTDDKTDFDAAAHAKEQS